MYNLFKIFKKQKSVNDIEVNEPEVIQQPKEDVMQVKPIDSTTIRRIELLHPVIRQEVKDIYLYRKSIKLCIKSNRKRPLYQVY